MIDYVAKIRKENELQFFKFNEGFNFFQCIFCDWGISLRVVKKNNQEIKDMINIKNSK